MSGAGPNNDVLKWGRIGRLLSRIPFLPDGLPVADREFSYGEPIVQVQSSKQHGANDEGSFFLTRTATVLTGLATTATPTTYVNTNAFLCITNGNPAGGANIWLDRISLACSAAGTAGTSLMVVTALDTIVRYSSGATAGGAGTNISTPMQGPMANNTNVPNAKSGALIYGGPLVVVAPGPSARILSNWFARHQIPVASSAAGGGDRLTINFGQSDMADTGDSGVAQASALSRTFPHDPVCIGPGGSFLLTLVLASQSAASSYEIEVAHIEK